MHILEKQEGTNRENQGHHLVTQDEPSTGSAFDKVRAAIDEYRNQFVPQAMPSFEQSGIYDLFPGEERSVEMEVAHNWPDSYPFCHRGGVYIQFGQRMELARIGQASSRRTLGGRLNDYFGYANSKIGDRTCRILEEWRVMPRFVMMFARTPATQEWHITGLESYLLETLLPPNNENPDNSSAHAIEQAISRMPREWKLELLVLACRDTVLIRSDSPKALENRIRGHVRALQNSGFM